MEYWLVMGGSFCCFWVALMPVVDVLSFRCISTGGWPIAASLWNLGILLSWVHRIWAFRPHEDECLSGLWVVVEGPNLSCVWWWGCIAVTSRTWKPETQVSQPDEPKPANSNWFSSFWFLKDGQRKFGTSTMYMTSKIYLNTCRVTKQVHLIWEGIFLSQLISAWTGSQRAKGA